MVLITRRTYNHFPENNRIWIGTALLVARTTFVETQVLYVFDQSVRINIGGGTENFKVERPYDPPLHFKGIITGRQDSKAVAPRFVLDSHRKPQVSS